MRAALLALSAAVLATTSPAAPPPHSAAPGPNSTGTQLPVTRVALYKSGVGFFEHTGRVSGDQSVTIHFTSAQLNDVLQTLTVLDRDGGRISGAGYNSTTPLDQQLRLLPLALGDNPSAADFYDRIRGARVEVHSAAGSLSGRLLSVETRTTEASDKQAATQKQFITVAAEGSGDVRTVELTPATTVRLLDPSLRADLARYLELIDHHRSEGLRHLTILDRGAGSRSLQISYLSEVPIWKSTYRILLTTSAGASPQTTGSASTARTGTATLQGWSVIDNTTGEDWNSVRLSLVAGSPPKLSPAARTANPQPPP